MEDFENDYDDDDDENIEDEEPTTLGAPASVDWRSSGAVGPVRNQGSCAGCYAFSSAAAMESIYKIKTGQLLQFSPQQIIDCSTGFRNKGCSGGLMTYSFNYLQSNKMMKESSYPFTGKGGACKYNAANGVVNTVGYTSLAKTHDALMNAVAQQPVSAGVNMNSSAFMNYKSGIISTAACGTTMNHAILVVGYGTENGTPYWLIKNSWGTGWGQAGYAKILRQPGLSGAGICGIQYMTSIPKI